MGTFGEIKNFYLLMKDDNITQTEWENCRRLYKVFKMRNVSTFNDVYIVQDAIIVIFLGVILENRLQ